MDAACAAIERDGHALLPSGLSTVRMRAVARRVDALGIEAAGARGLLRARWCRALAALLGRRLVRGRLLPGASVAVQCTYFDKTAARNWKVPLHQDLSVPVAARSADPRLGGWSGKEGALFVQPPDALLRRMLAVRLHLDDCPLDRGALCVVPGSHRLGRIRAGEAVGGTRVRCAARAGELLLMRPLLLHASSKSAHPDGRRRVLHFLFGPADPGFGLQWSVAA